MRTQSLNLYSKTVCVIYIFQRPLQHGEAHWGLIIARLLRLQISNITKMISAACDRNGNEVEQREPDVSILKEKKTWNSVLRSCSILSNSWGNVAENYGLFGSVWIEGPWCFCSMKRESFHIAFSHHIYQRDSSNGRVLLNYSHASLPYKIWSRVKNPKEIYFMPHIYCSGVSCKPKKVQCSF